MSYVSDWDSGGPNASWDSGLQWDVNVGPSPGDTSFWLNLITSEHRDKPNFMSMVQQTLQPFADILFALESLPGAFDLDEGIGAQLDRDGEWIGVSRDVSVPLSGVFFSWNTTGLGWNQSNWSPSISETQLIVLPDTQFRTLLFAKIAANHWDGTIPGAYSVWNQIFAGTGFGILIQDLQGMHMVMALTGPVPDAVTKALFTSGSLQLKPAGVRIDKFYTPAASNVPYMGWGVENASISGWNVGYWGVQSSGD